LLSLNILNGGNSAYAELFKTQRLPYVTLSENTKIIQVNLKTNGFKPVAFLN